MATITKNLLSGSVNGKNILLTATTSGSANSIHTAVAGTTSFDELWIYGYNTSAYPATAVLLWGDKGTGGTNESASNMRVTIPAQSGRQLIIDGRLLNNGLTVSGYANTASAITIDGFCNSIV